MLSATTIWKYPLEVTDEQVVALPKNSKALTVQVQGGQVMLWAMVEPKALNCVVLNGQLLGHG